MPLRFAPALALLLLAAACTPAPQAPATGAETVLILVRHAEKRTDQGDDPGLSPEGLARAAALDAALAHAGVSALVGSQFRRTTDTAAPLAARLGLTVQVRELDTADSPASAAALAPRLVEAFAGQTVLVVGHSNTIPRMVNALTGLDLDELDDRDYDNLFVVRVGPDGRGRLIRSRFGAADPVP